MKRFDIAVKVLQEELYRIVGKEVWKNNENKHYKINFSAKTQKAKGLKRAIDILTAHEENKHV